MIKKFEKYRKKTRVFKKKQHNKMKLISQKASKPAEIYLQYKYMYSYKDVDYTFLHFAKALSKIII